MNKNKEIAIYKFEGTELEIKHDKNTVWLTQKQIAELFGVNRPAITKHLLNIFKCSELKENSVSSILEHTALDGKTYKTNYYNLDAVISIGYRVNSNKATKFRIWATNVLRKYLLNGYVRKEDKKFKQLSGVVSVISHVIDQRNLDSDEAVSLLKVISDYTQALDLLDRYDHETLKLEKHKLSERKVKELRYEEAVSVIQQLSKSFGASTLFGKEKDKSFKSSIEGIYQTFGGKELYPSIEEKASNLLYFLVKNHSFVDGNKRIAASIFLYFINKNGILYKKDGTRILNDNALVAITLMIAESKPEHRDTIVKMLVNLIDKKN